MDLLTLFLLSLVAWLVCRAGQRPPRHTVCRPEPPPPAPPEVTLILRPHRPAILVDGQEFVFQTPFDMAQAFRVARAALREAGLTRVEVAL